MDELMELATEGINTERLCNDSLGKLSGKVAAPAYDRSKITRGIVHIGVGNFHRAHLAWYVHRLMQQGGASDWGIIGASVMNHDRVMRQKLMEQDCLTTLIELDPDGSQATEIIGPMLGYLPIEEDNASLIQAIADPRIRIVSLTITEGGYFIDPETGQLDLTHPDILHDADNPTSPRTAFGAMVAALRLRREAETGPLTGLCCDNLQGNGTILRQSVVGLARLADPELAAWIDDNCSFPNSMVDCIVPATGPRERQLASTLGIDDAVPVTHENFRQWVMEDLFCAGRPDWDLVGAEFTDEVHKFETRKIRILNGGHQIIANIGELLGHETISESMNNPLILDLFQIVQKTEILPFVPSIPDMTALDYLATIEKRFSNPAIADTVRRVAFDGSARHVGFLLPSIRDGLAANASVDGLALIEAIWARMCTGTREDGSQIEANDPLWDMLGERATEAMERPATWLEMAQIYGDTGQDARFSAAFETWHSRLCHVGVTETVRQYIEQSR